MDRIKHLHWRAGFGLSPEEWRERRRWPVERAVGELFRESGMEPPLPMPEEEQGDIARRQLTKEQLAELRMSERRRVVQYGADWITRMGKPGRAALLERVTLFWHGHFACRILQPRLAAAQLNTIRRYALGSFRDLAQAMARDVAMIRYLNNQQNRKEQPNENFARELLELFTIGRGHYTEQDVKEAARAFTGWSSNLRGDFVFRRFWHDNGEKTFFGRTGNFNGYDIIERVLEKRETAHFLTTKIYRYFVNPETDEDRVAELSRRYYESGYDTGLLLRAIFESDWFYAPGNMGAKIKSPVELLAGVMRTLGVRFEGVEPFVFVQRALGQQLFHPPNVAGWPGGKSWIDNSTLMLRLSLPGLLYNATGLQFRPKDDLKAEQRGEAVRSIRGELDFRPLETMLADRSGEEILRELCDYLLLTNPAVSDDLLYRAASRNSESDFIKSLTGRVMSLPEYQVC